MAEASFPDADLNLPDAFAAHFPAWVLDLLVRLILFLRQCALAAGHRRAPGVPSWFRARRPLLPGSAQTPAARVRGAVAHAIGWVRPRCDSVLGHRNWSAPATNIATFGGSVRGFRAGLPSYGLQRRKYTQIMPGKIGMAAATAVADAMAMRLSPKNDFAVPPPASTVAPAEAAPAVVRPAPAGERRDHARYDRQGQRDPDSRRDVNLSFAAT